MNILMVCDYRSPNPGNFIPSIRELDAYIQKCGGVTASFMHFQQNAETLVGVSK